MSANNNIKVAIKVRPLIPREKRNLTEEQWTVTQNSIVSLNNPIQNTVYHFDHVFGKESSNRDVFEQIAHPIVRQSLEGFNGTIFAYGQTSSGKTHTMLGNDQDPGITVMAVRQLFEENESDRTFMIRVGYIEIYNEKVYDLLSDRKQVQINQNGDNDIKLTNKEVIVKDGETILNILAIGNKLRKAAQTNMNETSSRSHAIFRIIIESEDSNSDGPVRVSYLNLVDLAGSEKANDAGTSGTRMKEGSDINKSLLYLGIAIRALSEGRKCVDFRSSKLTRILQASLGGNANTAIICNITPGSIEETASTLGFANQAKTVKNEAKCNEVFSAEDAFMKQMQAEIVRLKTELQQSAENEKKLKSEIAHKEATFLFGRNMRVKVDRRKTWHNMPGENSRPLSLIPRSRLAVTSSKSPSENGILDTTPIPETPLELRPQQSATPSPNQVGLKYRLGRIEKEYLDLQQFTALETRFDLHVDTTKTDSYIEKLEKDLKFAREEVEKYRQLSYEKLANGMSESNGMTDSTANGDQSVLNELTNELTAATDLNNNLMEQLAQLKSAHEREKETLNQQFKAARDAQDKAEILQAEGEITFGQYKKQTNQRINELISEVEHLKVNSVSKPVDLNISKMPIKVEPESSYELTELKFDLDQRKLEQERNKKTIESLESKLKVLTEERNALRSEHSELSARNTKTIKDLKLQLEEMNEKRNLLQSEKSTHNGKIIEDLELQVKTLTEERKVLQSEHTELSERHSKLIKDLESRLEVITEEKTVLQSKHSDFSERHNNIIEELQSQLEEMTEKRNILQSEHTELSERQNGIIKDLESQLETITEERDMLQSKNSGSNDEIIENLQLQVKTMTEERNTLQLEHTELSERQNNIIKDLESQLEAITDEKNILQSEHSDLSTQIMDYIEDLDQMKSKLDAMAGLQARADDLQRMYDSSCAEVDKLQAIVDENLHVIEKTEEECKTFKASLLESYDKIKISMEETESLNAKNESLCLEVSNLKNSLNTQSDEVDNLRKKLQEVQQQNSMLCSEKENDDNLQRLVEKLQKQHREEIAVKEEDFKTLTEQLQSDVDDLRAELNSKKQLLSTSTESFNANIAVLEADIREKKQQIDNFEANVSALKSQLNDQVHNYEATIDDLKSESNQKIQNELLELQTELEEKKLQVDRYKETTAKLQNDLSELKADLQQKLTEKNDVIIAELKLKQGYQTELLELKAQLQEKQKLIEKNDAVTCELKSNLNEKFQTELLELKAELQEKQKLIEKNDAVISELKANLNEKFQTELLELKAELQEKSQQVNDYKAKTSDVKAKFQNELLELKAQLQEKKLQVDKYEAMTSDLKTKSQNELSELKAKLQQKQNLIEKNDAVISELKSNQVCRTELLALKAQLQEKQKQIDKFEAMSSELKSKFQHDLLELKAELQLKQKQVESNEQTISKLRTELNEKDKSALSAKTVIASLESQLRSHGPEEPKKSPPKATKTNPYADRKARRYSQHDESRLWDDTIDPPSSIAIQTDPSDKNCSCESMNERIIELKRQVAVKTAVVNTQKLEMDNHPLIGENNDLKRILRDKNAEVQLLHMDVDHYKNKLQQAKKTRECACFTKVMESKEVQVDCDTSVSGVQNVPPNGQNGVLNEQNGHSNGQNGEDLSSLHTYCIHILPKKYRAAKDEIRKLEKVKAEYQQEKVAIIKKSDFYKELAVSRRADVKKLEAKLAATANGTVNNATTSSTTHQSSGKSS